MGKSYAAYAPNPTAKAPTAPRVMNNKPNPNILRIAILLFVLPIQSEFYLILVTITMGKYEIVRIENALGFDNHAKKALFAGAQHDRAVSDRGGVYDAADICNRFLVHRGPALGDEPARVAFRGAERGAGQEIEDIDAGAKFGGADL